MTNLLKKGNNEVHGFLVKTMGKWLKVTGLFLTNDDANDFCKKNKDHGVVACFEPIIITANLYDTGRCVTVKEWYEDM